MASWVKILEMGMKVSGQFEIRQAARPFMSELFEASKETVNSGVPDGVDILHIDKIDSREFTKNNLPDCRFYG